MTLIREHFFYYDHIFRIPGFLRDPVLVFGLHELTASPRRASLRNAIAYWWRRYQPKGGVWLRKPPTSHRMDGASLHECLCSYGVEDIQILDYFDERANVVHDMNQSVPVALHDAYGTLIDIGSIEHVFDTRQCLENMMRMVMVGGHILIHTPCGGYFNHGLHTFSPECLAQAFECNGFRIRWLTYSTPTGLELDSPQWFRDVLLWIVAEKTTPFERFVCPQQGRWKLLYRDAGETSTVP